MFSVTGPVISRPSAWRGEATNWMPNRPRSNDDRAEHVDVGFAAVAAAGAHLAQLERAAEQLPHLLVQRFEHRQRLPAREQVLAPPRGQAIVLREADRPGGQAPVHSVQNRQRPRSSESPCLIDAQGVGRAGLDAFAAPVGATGRVEGGRTPESIRQRGRLGRIAARAMALLEACKKFFDHGIELTDRGRSTTG